MASLRSTVIDGRILLAHNEAHEKEPAMRQSLRHSMEHERERLKSGQVILVNAQSVYDNLIETVPQSSNQAAFIKPPCPKPPFAEMWLEAGWPVSETERRRTAAMVTRYRTDSPEFVKWLKDSQSVNTPLVQGILADKPSTFIYGSVWQEQDGSAFYVGRFYYWLDADGEIQGYTIYPPSLIGEEVGGALVWVQHSFARMNCHNVRLVPAAGSPKIRSGKKHAPFSVWHEISVTSLPELRRAEPIGGVDGEKREIRFHKVRGHYADYTKGKGLFGKWKVRIWIEEHAAGEPEVGTVVSSYTIK